MPSAKSNPPKVSFLNSATTMHTPSRRFFLGCNGYEMPTFGTFFTAGYDIENWLYCFNRKHQNFCHEFPQFVAKSFFRMPSRETRKLENSSQGVGVLVAVAVAVGVNVAVPVLAAGDVRVTVRVKALLELPRILATLIV